MAEERTAQLGISVDASGAKQGFDEVSRAASGMASSVTQSADKAGKAVDSIGKSASESASQQARAYGRIEAEIRRVTAAAQAAAEGTGKSGEILNKALAQGLDPAKIEPQLRKLKELEAATTQVGVSAKQTAAAMRGVPAQFTDIITSIQGGQQPLTVLLQQGGQLKDMFGGAGAAARALGGYVLGLVNPFTVTAAAVAGVSIALHAASAEAQAMGRAITLSGNAAGTSFNQLQLIAERVSAATGATQGAVAASLEQIVATGKVSAGALESVSAAAIAMNRATGKAIDETVEEFVKLGADPVKASEKLNEQYNYLTASIYSQIKALEDQGKSAAAAALAQKAYADAVSERASKITQDLGTLEKAWKGLGDIAKSAWDKMLDLGRDGSLEQRIAQARKALEGGGFVFGGEAAARSQLAVLEAQLEAQQKQAKAAAEVSASEKAKIQWLAQGEKYLTKQAQAEREIAQIRTQGAAAGASQLEIEKRIAAVREKYADKGAIAELKREASELEKLMDRIAGKDIGLEGGFWKDLDVLFKAYSRGKVSLEEYAALVERLVQQQPFYVKGLKEEADALKARSDMMSRIVGDAQKQAEAAGKANDALRDEVIVLGLSKEEQAAYRAAKLESAAASDLATAAAIEEQAAYWEIAGVLPDIIAGYEQLAAAKRASAAALNEQAALTRERAAKDIAVDQAKESTKAWEKFASDIEQSLTDSLYRAFEAGEDMGEAFANALQNTFKTTVLKFAVQLSLDIAKQGATELLGGSLSGAGSTLSRGSDILSIGSSAYKLATGVGASAASLGAANVAGAVGGDALGTLIAGNAGTWGVSAAGVSGTSAALGTLAAAAPWIAAAMAIYSFKDKIFGGKKQYTGEQQLSGTFTAADFTGEVGRKWEKDGGWFRKDKSGFDNSAVTGDLDAALDQLVSATAEQFRSLADSIGADTLGPAIDQWSMFMVKDVSAGLDKAWATLSDEVLASMAATLTPSLHGLVKEGENTTATLARVTLETAAVAGALDIMGRSMASVFGGNSLDGILVLTDSLVQLAGGADAFSSKFSAYYDAFYSAEEKTDRLRDGLTESFDALGMALPATKDAFRNLLESLDLTSEAGQKAFTTMLSLAPAFSTLADSMDATARAASEAAARVQAERQSWQDRLNVLNGTDTERNQALRADLASTTDAATQAIIRQVYAQQDLNAAAEAAAQQAAAIASERAGLESRLLQLQGDTAAIRERELAALDASNRALLEQIYSLEDAAAAQQASAEAARIAAQEEANRRAEAERAAQEAAAAAARIASERENLQARIWQLEGNTAALRERELAALDPANRELQEYIYTLEDAAAAAQKAQAVESERQGLMRQLYAAQGNTAALRALELQGLDESNRALQQQIWALEDQKAAAEAWHATWDNITKSLRDQAQKLRGDLAGDNYAALAARFTAATAAARAGDAGAAGSLVGLSDSLLAAYNKEAGSALEARRMQAWVADSLDTTAGLIVPPPSADAAAAGELKGLREEQKAQAKAITQLLMNMEKLYSRWDRDGMPAVRAEV